MLRTILNNIFGATVGASWINLIAQVSQDSFIIFIENWVQTLFSVIGIIYFLSSWPHKRKMQKLDREIKYEELEKIKRENDIKEKSLE